MTEPAKDNASGIRLSLTRAVTRKKGDDYDKTIAGIESELPPGMDALEGLNQLKGTLTAFFSETSPAAPPPKRDNSEPAKIDFRSLDSILQGPTKKGSYWCFSDKPEAAQLKALLEKSPNKSLEIHGYTFKISGDSGQFINRWGSGKQASPVKE